MKNVVFWEVMPCSSCKNRRFGVSIIRVTRIGEQGTLAVTSNRNTLRRIIVWHIAFLRNVCSYNIHSLLDKSCSSETSVRTRATERNIPEDGIPHSVLQAVSVASNSDNRLTPSLNKQTPWPLVRERTIPTERPPLVDEI
jgi:hypothetical protein